MRVFSGNATTGEIAGYQGDRGQHPALPNLGYGYADRLAATIGPGTATILLASWLKEIDLLPAPGEPASDQVGYIGFPLGATLPEWTINANLNYAWSGWSLGTARRPSPVRRVTQWPHLSIHWYRDLPNLLADASRALGTAFDTTRAGQASIAGQLPYTH